MFTTIGKTLGKNCFIIICILLYLIGCTVSSSNYRHAESLDQVGAETLQANNDMKTPTMVPASSTPTKLLLTATPVPALIPTAIPVSSYSNWRYLEPGEYIAFEIRGESEMEAIGVLSLSTMETSILSILPGRPLTPDGHFISLSKKYKNIMNISDSDNVLAIFDLWKSELITIPIPDDCLCDWSATDSELEYVLGSCSQEGGFPYFLKMIGEKRTCVTISQDFEIHNSYQYPFFSPDANWIAFYELQSMSPKEQIDDGLYIMPADCLEDPDTCHKLMNGPYKIPNTFGSIPIWSKNSNFLAVVIYEELTIRIFDLTKRAVVKTLEIETSADRLQMVDWLNNGDLIASVRNQENRNSFDLVRYRIDTDQTEIIASEMDGQLLFTFTKE